MAAHCLPCSMICNTSDDYNAHIKTHEHDMNIRKYCNVCDFRAGSPAALTRHMKTARHKRIEEICAKMPTNQNTNNVQEKSDMEPDFEKLSPNDEIANFVLLENLPEDKTTVEEEEKLSEAEIADFELLAKVCDEKFGKNFKRPLLSERQKEDHQEIIITEDFDIQMRTSFLYLLGTIQHTRENIISQLDDIQLQAKSFYYDYLDKIRSNNKKKLIKKI